MKLKIKALAANHGDAIVLEIGSIPETTFKMLVDGGPPGVMAKTNHPRLKTMQAGALLQQLDAYRGAHQTFDLTVLTHIDSDHIGGLLAAYRRKEYRQVIGKNVWFNSARLIAAELKKRQPPESDILINPIVGSKTSFTEAVDFDDLLDDSQSDRKLITTETPPLVYDWGTIHVLSPTIDQLSKLLDQWVKEKPDTQTSGKTSDYSHSIKDLQANDTFSPDTSVTNASSIGLLIKCSAGIVLLLGDALSSTVSASLRRLNYSEDNKLNVDVCKVSHHGSKGNTCEELLSLINVRNFIISTNGGKQLPDKQTIARILKFSPNSNIIFNYPELKNRIFTKDELNVLHNNLPDLDELVLGA
jgi:hypothetical protein